MLSHALSAISVQTLTSDLSADFAHRTFIPFGATFGDAFLQGRVVGVDTEGQVVLLEGGQVSTRTRLHFLTEESEQLQITWNMWKIFCSNVN